MKKTFFYTALFSSLFLPIFAQAEQTYNMQCEDGQAFQIAYPNEETAIIFLDSELFLLKAVKENHYAGKGWQWTTKGRTGELAVLIGNEKIASEKGISCQIDRLDKASTLSTQEEGKTEENTNSGLAYPDELAKPKTIEYK